MDIKWGLTAPPTSAVCQGMATDGGICCAISYDAASTNTRVYRFNGSTWSLATTLIGNWVDIAAISGRFCVIKNTGSVTSSPDGLTWTQDDTSFTGTHNNIVAANGKFFVSVGGTIKYSNTGLAGSWADTTAYAATGRIYVAYNGTAYCLVISNARETYTSTNGVTWTYNSTVLPSFRNWSGIVAKPGGKFVVTNNNGVQSNIQTSNDGVTWSAVTVTSFAPVGGIAWDGENFILIKSDSSFALYYPYVSADGITWVNAPVEAFLVNITADPVLKIVYGLLLNQVSTYTGQYGTVVSFAGSVSGVLALATAFWYGQTRSGDISAVISDRSKQSRVITTDVFGKQAVAQAVRVDAAVPKIIRVEG